MPKEGERTKFAMDHMMIRLGKYLRVIGYDTIWNPNIRTHDLILQANAEGRVFVTRNHRLPDEYPPVRESFAPVSGDPVQQFHEVVRAFHLDVETRLFVMCISCNVDLVRVPDRNTIREFVHPNVFLQHQQFYQCPRCGTIFWLGSHVRNTCRKLGLLPPG